MCIIIIIIIPFIIATIATLSTIVIPSDPDALTERLELLLASKAAGNTGVRNELVSICDELPRQKMMSKKQYKKLMTHI